jgi:isoleucyl-tRNA synthetase
MPWPADLYLEGGDQYRGWFHSSLLVAVGTRGHAPYRGVATNGWTLDPQGRATSKSLGNGIDPVKIAESKGAEIIRLWVASVDFQQDVTVSDELMDRIGDDYRNVRNTLRYIVNNLFDFNPSRDAVRFADMQGLDQYELLLGADFAGRVRAWYENFEFHRIYQQLNEYCNSALSNIYFAAIKDRLYTAAPNSRARRSAQTAVWKIGDALVRLLAPIASFTAEEVWHALPRTPGKPESVHLAYFPRAEELYPEAADSGRALELRADFESLLAVRAEALKPLEVARKEKLIGRSEEAAVTIYAPANLYSLLERYRNELRFLLVVSALELKNAVEGNGGGGLRVEVEKAPGQKCERCWFYSTQVGKDGRYPTVCERCSAVLHELETLAVG